MGEGHSTGGRGGFHPSAKIVGICGRAESGKTRMAKALFRHFNHPNHWRHRDEKIFSFSRRLKDVCAEHFPFLREAFYGTHEQKDRVHPAVGKSGRQVMEIVGETFRSIYPNVWVNAEMRSAEFVWTDFEWIFFDDVRHPDQEKKIHSLGGVVVRLGGGQERESFGEAESKMDLVMADFAIGETDFDRTLAGCIAFLEDWRKSGWETQGRLADIP